MFCESIQLFFSMCWFGSIKGMADEWEKYNGRPDWPYDEWGPLKSLIWPS